MTSFALDYRFDLTHYIEYIFKFFQGETTNSKVKIVSYSTQFGKFEQKLNFNRFF